MAKVNHGICERCNHEMICEDNLTCKYHSHLTHHFDPLDCIALLKEDLDIANAQLNDDPWDSNYYFE